MTMYLYTPLWIAEENEFQGVKQIILQTQTFIIMSKFKANRAILSQIGNMHLVNASLDAQQFTVAGKVEDDTFNIEIQTNAKGTKCVELNLQGGAKAYIYSNAIRSLVEKGSFDRDGSTFGGFDENGNFKPGIAQASTGDTTEETPDFSTMSLAKAKEFNEEHGLGLDFSGMKIAEVRETLEAEYAATA